MVTRPRVTLVTLTALVIVTACEPESVVDPCAAEPSTDPIEPAPPEIPWLSADGTETLEVEAPAPAMRPVLTPCPTGWITMDRDGLDTCEPWVDGVRATCPGTQRAQVGAGCVDIGIACDPGRFRADAPPRARSSSRPVRLAATGPPPLRSDRSSMRSWVRRVPGPWCSAGGATRSPLRSPAT